MTEPITMDFNIDGEDFTRAGEASSSIKHALKKIGLPSDIIRKVAIAVYEGEINMFIHANGGKITMEIHSDKIELVLADQGPGIPDIDKAMQEGFSTAPAHVRDMGFGAGMGLPNMKKNTDAMRIESVPGQGTTIYMTVNT